MKAAGRILLVDENADDRRLIELVLGRDLTSCSVHAVADASAFAAALAGPVPAAVITEQALAWSDALGILRAVKGSHPTCPVVVFTASGHETLIAEALAEGLDGYVIKNSAGYLRLPGILSGLLSRESDGSENRDGRLVNALPVGVFVGVPDEGVVRANAAMAHILGADDASALMGQDLGSFLTGGEAQDRWSALLAEGTAIDKLTVEIWRSDGELAWVRLSAWPRGRGYEGTLEDISEYRRNQTELAQQADALRSSNQELEQFAYVVSHDLQQPLNQTATYARMIADKLDGDENKDTSRFAERVVQGTDRMQRMIDDILAYSRVGTRGQDPEPVPLASAVENAVENQKVAIDRSGATVSWGALPTLAADPAQMTQLFQNLIGNAIKFRGDEAPRVNISAEENRDDWIIRVSDNGIGIPPEQHARIFEMFQRLHTESEFPGTGIGLAICARVVKRHGGRIWVESEPGEGATFHIQLPKSANHGGVPEGDD